MNRFRIWLALVALVIAAGVAVPYGFLAGGTASLDIFVFWCAFGAVMVALIAVGVARWRG